MSTRIGIPVRLSDPALDNRVAVANRLIGLITDRVSAAGGIPVPLTPETWAAGPDIDGLLLPGGGDLHPRCYGQEPDPRVYDTNPAQDDLDFAAAKHALEKDLPIFGICRGMQLINVLYGGTLIQDLPPSDIDHRHRHTADPAGAFARHPVDLLPGSRLAALLGTTAPTASAHHQAVDRLGEGLMVTARAADGCIEAIEDQARQVLAVQWHPEVLASEDPRQQAIFKALVDAARQNKSIQPSTNSR
ncbi:gamma-glutamyl-gamma-aminobutyrate hydrolase family protein [Arthrobacter mangrovi]|uniref:Gamma-glutamyl-gamma-aminobutyrate hydrolase n=1 Tax=Arthrobacter mangrovi TaxID=2966350 RepID=A0ABQ5MWE9_9MICC|nr:gamma-glutamyl-gamma-aminobutyrate hydrolase family protein [Arthrobacter mangrovi]GLB68304.1 gamma-glutamyl-gamma-aminobutyrate hydrolase [Arthrobacter mangrovi]